MKSDKKLLTSPIVVCLLAMVCCALWGSAFAFIKIGYDLFDIKPHDTASQLLFAGIRFFIAGILVVIFAGFKSRKFPCPKAENTIKIAVLSLFQTILQYIFFYVGLAHTSAAKASVINGAGVFFAVLFSAVVLKQEKLSLKNIIGCIIGFAGVFIINLSGAGVEMSFSLTGDGFIILSAVAYAVSSALIKKYSAFESPVILSGYQFILGGFVMTCIGLIFGGRIKIIDAKSLALLVYLALLSAAAYTLWGVLLKHNNVSSVCVYGFMTQIFGCMFSLVFLKESLRQSPSALIISLVLVSIGIIVVSRENKAPR